MKEFGEVAIMPTLKCIGIGLLFVAGSVAAISQQPAPARPMRATAPLAPAAPRPVSEPAPVVTVVRSLSGANVLALLTLNGSDVASAPEALAAAPNAATHISAGIVIDGLGTIAVLLPRAEAEFNTLMEVPLSQMPSIPYWTPRPVPAAAPAAPVMNRARPANTSARPEAPFMVLKNDRRGVTASFIGLDGGTGLSLISVRNASVLTGAKLIDENQVHIGQEVRIFAPSGAQLAGSGGGGMWSVRMEQRGGVVSDVIRNEAGKLTKISVRIPRLDNLVVGGVVVDENGGALGIIESFADGKAQVLPGSSIRTAAARVLARRAASPRPWIGVRGQALSSASWSVFQKLGWSMDQFGKVKNSSKGVLLTSVIPGTPAQEAALKPGDIVVKINENFVDSTEDLSRYLSTIEALKQVNLTLLRPDRLEPLTVGITPTRVVDPVAATLYAERRAYKAAKGWGWGTVGVDVLRVMPAAQNGEAISRSVLVIAVWSGSRAASAGLKSGDIIETVNGQPATAKLPDELSKSTLHLQVKRHGQLESMTIPASENTLP